MAAIRLLFFVTSLALAAAQTTTTSSTCVEAHNFLNAQYTVPVNVGTPAQTLHVVADTGSFEGVFASAECVGCGKHLRFVVPLDKQRERLEGKRAQLKG